MDIEFQSREEIQRLQEQLLREQVAYLETHYAYYRAMFDAEGMAPESIRTNADLKRLPFTEKKDLQLRNAEFLCCPREDIIDFVTTSGTLGDPVTFGCTEEDLQRLAYNEQKSFACAGITKNSVV